MQLHTLPKAVSTPKKRLGQGHGSGRVKTSGRGTKGQNARSSRPLYFEGGALPLIKRIPFQRGKSRNKALNEKPAVINLDLLSLFPVNSEITIDVLLAKKLIDDNAKRTGVKLLGRGTVEQAYIIKIPASKSAAEKITKAGGSVEIA